MELIFEIILNLGIIILDIFDFSNLMSNSKLDKNSMAKIRRSQIYKNGLMVILMVVMFTTIPVLTTISIWFIVPIVIAIIAIITIIVNMNIKYFKQKNSKI